MNLTLKVENLTVQFEEEGAGVVASAYIWYVVVCRRRHLSQMLNAIDSYDLNLRMSAHNHMTATSSSNRPTRGASSRQRKRSGRPPTTSATR